MADPVNDIVKEIPFAELVRKAALAVADGQTALDLNSIQTAQTLADMELDAGAVILGIVEETDADGNVTNVSTLTNDQPLSLLAYGVTPTFYEFSETEIDLKFFSIGGKGGYQKQEVKGEREVELDVRTHSEYDSRVYGLDASAACRLQTTLVPKPAPDRSVPDVITRPAEGGSS